MKTYISRAGKSVAGFGLALCMILSALLMSACDAGDHPGSGDAGAAAVKQRPQVSSGEIPEYSGEPYVEINGNEPDFDDELRGEDSFESYGELDSMGRCTTAVASLSEDTAPEAGEERGDISSIHPTGWKSGCGWERCHLIGWQLSAENDNEENLITGTHYMNVSAMLPFENEVDDYIEATGNHVLYQVTPVYDGDSMVASGVAMEAESVEDRGSGVSFNVFCFNVTPGAEIDYRTGAVEEASGSCCEKGKRKYVLNTNTMKFHYPSCSSVQDMSEHNRETVHAKRSSLIKQGYEPCGRCEP